MYKLQAFQHRIFNKRAVLVHFRSYKMDSKAFEGKWVESKSVNYDQVQVEGFLKKAGK